MAITRRDMIFPTVSGRAGDARSMEGAIFMTGIVIWILVCAEQLCPLPALSDGRKEFLRRVMENPKSPPSPIESSARGGLDQKALKRLHLVLGLSDAEVVLPSVM